MTNPRLVFLEANASGSGLGAVRRSLERHGLDVTFCTGHLRFFESLPGGDVLKRTRVLEVDTFDPAAVIARLVAEGSAPDGVIALDDYHLESASVVASYFGLPGHGRASLKRARRKDLMRAALAEAGCPQPDFWVLKDAAAARSIPHDRPLVVKPVDDSGGVAVQICKGPDQTVAAVNHSLSRSVNVRGYRLTPRCLVEAFIDGPEYSAELIRNGSRWQLLGFTTKALAAGPHPIEVGHAYPSDLHGADRFVGTQVINWLNALGLDWGAVHVEFKLRGDVAMPIEINPRLAGGRISELMGLVDGSNPVDRLISMAVGRSDLPVRGTRQGAAAISFLLPPRAGLVASVRGLDAAGLSCGVQSVGLCKALPSKCQRPSSNYDQLAYVIACAEDTDEAQLRADAAASLLQVVYG